MSAVIAVIAMYLECTNVYISYSEYNRDMVYLPASLALQLTYSK